MYKPHISGITNYIELSKRYLEKAGHEVYVFTFGDTEYKEEDPRVIRSPGLPLVDTDYYFNFRYNHTAKALLQTMDIVHVHHPFVSGRLALRYCRPLRIPIIFTNHTRYDLYMHAYLPLLPGEVSDTLLEVYMPPFCDAIDLTISPSQGMAKVLRNLGVKSNIEVVPNGVELQRFKRLIEPTKRIEHGFNEDDILFIYVGRLGPEKNVSLLMSTFAGVAETLKNIHLIILGKGPEEKAYRSQAEKLQVHNRIHFMGLIAYESLPAYLTMSDVFVTASLTEVHPLSVIEAMASGLPVLGIQSVGVGDTVETGISGLLASENPASFAAMMTRLGMDATLRRTLGENARKASEQYDIVRTTEIMISLYEHLVAKAKLRQRGLRYRLRSFVERFK